MVERIRITHDQLVTRDANGNVIFDSNALYVKKNQSAAQLFVGGYRKVPMSYGGVFLPPELSPYQGGYVVYSASLFSDTPQAVERWVPSFTGVFMTVQQYLKFFTIERFVYTSATPYTAMKLQGTTIANVEWIGAICRDLNNNYVIRLAPQFTWLYSDFWPGYLSLPFTFAQNFYYTDSGALYLGEYGNISTAKFCFDLTLDCAPKAYYYGITS